MTTEYPKLPDLTDEQLQALADYGRFWSQHYYEGSLADAERLTAHLQRPGESTEAFEERVPPYQRGRLSPGDVRRAAKDIAQNEQEAERWSNFSSLFRDVLNSRERARQKEAFEAHNIVVADDLTPTLDAFVNLGVPLPGEFEEDDPDRYQKHRERTEAFRWEYREVSLDGEFVGYVRRKPRQSFWSHSVVRITPEGLRDAGKPYVAWADGGYGSRYRSAKAAADGLAKAVITERAKAEAVTA